MLGSLLITLREGLEASLIIGIILAYLARTGDRKNFKPVWLGAGAAVCVSLVVGAVIYLVAGEFSGKAEQIFEGSAMFLAVGVLTWMVFWMRKQSVSIKSELQTKVESALTSGSNWGLAAIAFLAVVREGIETVLFLFAASGVAASAVSFITGGLLGLFTAVLIGYGIYKGSSKINLRTFFNVTGLVLLVFAAGLLAAGIGEFHEAGIIPPLMAHLWDTSRFITEDSTLGEFLKAVLGYNSSPSAAQVIGYLGYLVLTLPGYFSHRSLKSGGSR